MQKKTFFIVGAVLVAGGLVGGAFFYFSKQNSTEIVSPDNEKRETGLAPTKTTTAEKLLLWEDQAGFTFQYPSSIKINKHPEDKTNYAHLDLYIDGKDGAVKILASDTKYKSAMEWATKEKKNSQVGGGGTEITLSGKSAKKITFPDTQTVIVGIVDEGLLFTIELIPDKEGYWQKTFDQVVSSFKFVYPTAAPAAETSGDSGTDIVGEEIIE